MYGLNVYTYSSEKRKAGKERLDFYKIRVPRFAFHINVLPLRNENVPTYRSTEPEWERDRIRNSWQQEEEICCVRRAWGFMLARQICICRNTIFLAQMSGSESANPSPQWKNQKKGRRTFCVSVWCERKNFDSLWRQKIDLYKYFFSLAWCYTI